MDCIASASDAVTSPPLTTTVLASSRSPAPLEPVTSAAIASAVSTTSNSTSAVNALISAPSFAPTGPSLTVTVSIPTLLSTWSPPPNIAVLLSEMSTSLSVPAKLPNARITSASATVKSAPEPFATTVSALKIAERASLPLFSPSTIALAESVIL